MKAYPPRTRKCRDAIARFVSRSSIPPSSSSSSPHPPSGPRPLLRHPGRRRAGTVRGNRDAAKINGLPRPARRQRWSGQAEVAPRPESLPRTDTNPGPELSRVTDPNPALVGGCRRRVVSCFVRNDRNFERSPCARRCVGPKRATRPPKRSLPGRSHSCRSGCTGTRPGLGPPPKRSASCCLRVSLATRRRPRR
jgi:hypothetical protein